MTTQATAVLRRADSGTPTTPEEFDERIAFLTQERATLTEKAATARVTADHLEEQMVLDESLDYRKRVVDERAAADAADDRVKHITTVIRAYTRRSAELKAHRDVQKSARMRKEHIDAARLAVARVRNAAARIGKAWREVHAGTRDLTVALAGNEQVIGLIHLRPAETRPGGHPVDILNRDAFRSAMEAQLELLFGGDTTGTVETYDAKVARADILGRINAVLGIVEDAVAAEEGDGARAV